MNLKEFINEQIEKKSEYGLPDSRQNMIDEMVEIAENVMREQKDMVNPEQVFQIASEIKFRDDMDKVQQRIEDSRIQVLDIIKEKYSKIVKSINNDKETSNKEKDDKNGYERKGKESSTRRGR
jgi:TRAP-type mannitol/chloroaromatic compound transport system substrate-binding protein